MKTSTSTFMIAALLASCPAYAGPPDDLKTAVLQGLQKISQVKDYRDYIEFSGLLNYEPGKREETILIPNQYSDVNGKSTSIDFKRDPLSIYGPAIPWANFIHFKEAGTRLERAVLNLQISNEGFCLATSEFMSVFPDATVERSIDGTLLSLSYRVTGKKRRTVSSLFSGDCAINFVATQIL